MSHTQISLVSTTCSGGPPSWISEILHDALKETNDTLTEITNHKFFINECERTSSHHTTQNNVEDPLFQKISKAWDRGEEQNAIAQLLLLFPTAESLRTLSPIWFSRLHRAILQRKTSLNKTGNETSNAITTEEFSCFGIQDILLDWSERNIIGRSSAHCEETGEIILNNAFHTDEEANVYDRSQCIQKHAHSDSCFSLDVEDNKIFKYNDAMDKNNEIIREDESYSYTTSSLPNVSDFDDYNLDCIAEGFIARLLHRSLTAKETNERALAFGTGLKHIIHSLFLRLHHLLIAKSKCANFSIEMIKRNEAKYSTHSVAHMIVLLIVKGFFTAFDICDMHDDNQELLSLFFVALISKSVLQEFCCNFRESLDQALLTLSRAWHMQLTDSNDETNSLSKTTIISLLENFEQQKLTCDSTSTRTFVVENLSNLQEDTRRQELLQFLVELEDLL